MMQVHDTVTYGIDQQAAHNFRKSNQSIYTNCSFFYQEHFQVANDRAAHHSRFLHISWPYIRVCTHVHHCTQLAQEAASNNKSNVVVVVLPREAVLLPPGPRRRPHRPLHHLPGLPAQPGGRRRLLHRCSPTTHRIGVCSRRGRECPPAGVQHPRRRAHDGQEALTAAPDPHGVRAPADARAPPLRARGRPIRALRAAHDPREPRVRGAREPGLRRRAAVQLHRERGRRQDVRLLRRPAGDDARRRRRRRGCGRPAPVRLRDEGGRRHVSPAGRAGGDAAAGAAGGHVLRRGPAVHGQKVAAVHARHGLHPVLGPRPVDRHLRHGQKRGQRCRGCDNRELAKQGQQGQEQGEHLPQNVRLQERRGQGFLGGHHWRAPAEGGHQICTHAGALQRHPVGPLQQTSRSYNLIGRGVS